MIRLRAVDSPGGSDDGPRSGPKLDLDAQLDQAVGAEPTAAFLLVVAGEQTGRVFPLVRNTIILGRGDDADVKVVDRAVSTHHARIISGGVGYELEDLSSTNGTYVAGRRIDRCRLKNGDRIRLGGVEFAFLLDKESDATVALVPAAAPPVRALIAAGALPRVRRERYVPDDEDDGPRLAEAVVKAARLYRTIRNHAVTIAVGLAAGTLIGIASAFVVPPAASAVCEVRLRPDAKVSPVENEWRPPEADPIQFFSNAERAFTNDDLVRSTLVSMGDSDPTTAAVSSTVDRLRFQTTGHQLFEARFKEGFIGKSKHSPVAFLTAHTKNYVKTEIEKTLRTMTDQVDFLRAQLAAENARLDAVNAELVKFRESNADRLPEQATQAHASRFQMESRRTELTAQVRRLDGELDALRRHLAQESPLAASRVQSSQVYRDAIASVNRRMSEARARGLADEHPEMRALREEKRLLDAQVSQQLAVETTSIERTANVEFQALRQRADLIEAQLRAARSELGDLERELGRVRGVVTALPRATARQEELMAKREATQRLANQLFDKLKKLELQLELERVSVSSRYEIVAPPRLDQRSGTATLLLRTALGLAVGLIFALLIVGFREGKRFVTETLAATDEARERDMVRP